MSMRDPVDMAAQLLAKSEFYRFHALNKERSALLVALIREAQEDGARGEREKVAKAEQQESFWRAIATRNLKGTEDAIGRTAFESLIGQALFAILESTTGAVNCIEFSVHKRDGERLCVVSVTRPEGKNPLALRAEAEAQVAALTERAEKAERVARSFASWISGEIDDEIDQGRADFLMSKMDEFILKLKEKP